MPASIKRSKEVQIVEEKSFSFLPGNQQAHCDVMEHAFRRYHLLIFEDHEGTSAYYGKPANVSILKSLVVNLQKSCFGPDEQMPTEDMDESYTLKIAPGKAVLSANEVWGALRGLETFSQLVYKADEGYFAVNNSAVEDKPRFPHRGIMLDTSRHFLPMEIIYLTLDGMSYNKFNVFHWHIVDDNSFPYESTTFPELSKKGAFEPYSHVYTQEDVFRVIEYARVLGIRVIPEFDTPGHAQSWGKSHPELLTRCYKDGKWTGEFGPLDPTSNATYTFVEKLLSEVVTVFKDKYVHLGGDEVNFNCWQSNPAVIKFMKKMGYGTDFSKLEEYYMQKVLNSVNHFKRKTLPIIWQEVVDNNVKVPKDTVVHVWKDRDYPDRYKAELGKVTGMGLRTLLSACWYVNVIHYPVDWYPYYQCDPQDFKGTAAQKALVFGGEAALWGELVDSTNAMSRLWPRGSAAGERLWSPANVKDIDEAAPRLEEHRCRMVARGIAAEPPNGPGFCVREYSELTPRRLRELQREMTPVTGNDYTLRFRSRDPL